MARYALVGFMAAGKSAVGRQLSQLLNSNFIDLDEQIEQTAKRSIPEIFRSDGEGAFRHIEQSVLATITAQYKTCVLATGGGAVSHPLNREILKQHWHCIYLRATPEVVLQRVRQDGNTRPLLADVADPLARIRELLKERQPWYEEVAELRYDVDNKAVPTIAHEIVSDLHE